jgi:hypothetical protein
VRNANIAFAALSALFCVYVFTAAFWSRGGNIHPRHNAHSGREPQ